MERTEDVIQEVERLIADVNAEAKPVKPRKSGTVATVRVGNGQEANLDALIEKVRKAHIPEGWTVADEKKVGTGGDVQGPQAGVKIGGATSDWYRHTAAEALLPPLRRNHPHLDEAYIVVLSGPLGHAEGCKTLGRARRLKKTERVLIRALGVHKLPDYVIEVDTESWEKMMDASQRLALLEHELCHLAGRDVDDDGVVGEWKLKGHDLEEFLPVLQRHGAWRTALKDFVKIARQPNLPGME